METVVNTNNGQPMTPEQLYAANLASCVGITVNTTVNIFGQTTTSAASGSGFVLSRDGYIATNYHVIESAVKDSSVTIQVTLTVVGVDNGFHPRPVLLIDGSEVFRLDGLGVEVGPAHPRTASGDGTGQHQPSPFR